VLGSLVLWPGVAAAQSTIAGAVHDTTGAILPGVTVEASSPALIEKIRAAVTDGQGRYSIVDLRPGVYTMTFSLAGFRTVRREGVEVIANASVPINAELQVGALEETITVSGATPVVDVQQAGQRQVLNREVLDMLPSARQAVNAGVIIPGLRLTAPSMGGVSSTSVLGSYLMARGRPNSENSMEVDGMDVRASRGDGQQAQGNFAMAQEVTYQVNAISAEAQGGGVRISLVPRDGGNQYAGEFFVSGMHHAWQNNNITPELIAQGLPTPDGTRYMYELTPAFGGRIIRDRLWFFGSVRVERKLLAPAGATFFATGEPGYNRVRGDNVSGRLTWQASERNKVTFYHDQHYRYQSHYRGRANQDWATQPTVLPLGHQFVQSLKWTSPVTNRVLFEAGYSAYGYHQGLNEFQPGVLKERGTPEWYASAARLDLVTGLEWMAWDGFCCQDWRQPAHVLQSSVSYVTGSHNAKAGIQWRRSYTDTTTQEGNGALKQRYRNGVPDSVSIPAVPAHTRVGVDPEIGLYAQDSWTIKRLTVNAGLRFDYFDGKIYATEGLAGRFVSPRSVEEFRPFPAYTDLNPRFSAVYDLFGNAKTALKFNASRYVTTYGSASMGVYNPISTTADVRNWFDCDFMPGTSTCSGRVLPTNGDDIAQDNEIGPSNNANFGRTPGQRVDGELKRPYNWDYSVSVQHELLSGVSVVGSWYWSRSGNLQAVRNVALTVNDYTPFQVANPLDNQDAITVFNLNRARQGLVDNVVRSSDLNRETYSGFEASMQARLPRGMTVAGGWFGDRTLRTTCDTNNPNELRFCDETGELYQELGQVPTLPFRHEFKLAATSPLPWGFRGGLSFVSLPGNGGYTSGNAPPVPYLNLGWVVPPNLFPGGRTQSVTVILNPPGSRYLPRLNQLDMTVKRTFRAGRMEVLPGIAIYNLLNSSVVTQEANISTAGMSGSFSLGRPLATIQGRFLRLEAMVKF